MTERDRSWDTPSTEALRVHIKHQDARDRDISFAPAFTYPIFGDEEKIFGYRNLRMQLSFTCDTLQPSFEATYDGVYPSTTETQADNLEELLKDFVPSAFDIAGSSSAPNTSFQPPGKLLKKYIIEGRSYGIWFTTLEDAAARRILMNMQVFVPFFIEGGLLLDLDLHQTWSRWTVFYIYEQYTMPSNPSKTLYSFVGYSTAYQLYYLDRNRSLTNGEAAVSSEYLYPQISSLFGHIPSRFRISQFVILPPYQSSGHGAFLYNSMMSYARSKSAYQEITVEDPNESFDALRDVNDLLYLYQHVPRFAALSINPDAKLSSSKADLLPISQILIPESALENLRRATKLHTRQFYLLLEAHLLSQIPSLHRNKSRLTRKDKASDPRDRAYYFWRLLVKSRLTSHNKDALSQLDTQAEKIEKLDETVDNVEEGYYNTIQRMHNIQRKHSLALEAVLAKEQAKNWWIRDPDGEKEGMLMEYSTHDPEGSLGSETRLAAKKDRGAKRRIVDEDDEDESDHAMDRNGTNGKRTKLNG